MAALQRAVEDHKPVIAELAAAHQQGRGMATLARIAWTVLAGGAGAALVKIFGRI